MSLSPAMRFSFFHSCTKKLPCLTKLRPGVSQKCAKKEKAKNKLHVVAYLRYKDLAYKSNNEAIELKCAKTHFGKVVNKSVI